MAGRRLPALHDLAGELGAFEAAAVEVPGQVLGNEAVLIALCLRAILRFAAVRLVREFSGFREVCGEGARGCGQRRVRLHLLQRAGLAEGVGQLDDGNFGLRQVWKHAR